MCSLIFYDIPSVIIALLGVPLLLIGGWLGIDTIARMHRLRSNTTQTGGEGMAIIIVLCSVFAGLAAILFGIWCVKENKFKHPMAVYSGLLTVGFLKLIEIVEFIETLRYDAIVQLLTLSIAVLVWCLLWGIELRWEMSFSQQMDQ
ncbi:hypothetical protein [Natrinema versiforme]|uniref:Uncharacterized protein n=1 Tax=Natrinema versiforme TaxID=88724 RepID=A0A4P8WQF7_9EURY|nr:hypothetical protein [Natrinema versiforme]QCS44753.1 hypothetical protein FEJ81_20995 [Natrinema versiforme]